MDKDVIDRFTSLHQTSSQMIWSETHLWFVFPCSIQEDRIR